MTEVLPAPRKPVKTVIGIGDLLAVIYKGRVKGYGMPLIFLTPVCKAKSE